ncbi:MAG: alpha/beta fold hydrolase, partial [Candidatus Puniceispirillaceae bacterium]
MGKLFEGAPRIFEVNGTHIAYRSAGNGPALLLLHGYPQTMFMWHLVADRLAENYSVVLADLRGYGDSGKPPTDARHSP